MNNKDLHSRTLARQYETIEKLNKKVEELEIDNKAKDEIISAIDQLRENMVEIVEDLKTKSRKYDELLDKMYQMKSKLEEYVFTK